LNPPTIPIAVDVMGGDHGPSVTLPAVLRSLSDYSELAVALFCSPEVFHSEARTPFEAYGERVRFVACSHDVTMQDKPSQALRHKQSSSMYQAVSMLSCGEADACVSAGNTGALMAMGKFLVHTFPGIERPAVCAEMPTENGRCFMLDLGANVDCRAQHFLQFAIMGSELARIGLAIEQPRVALLNIGEEESKGNEQVRVAAGLLAKNRQIHYIGFVEGNDIYNGKADVIVCDGFVGNVVLKASEGVARLIASRLRQFMTKDLSGKENQYLMKPMLENLLQQINPSRYNGATILGLQRTIVVSHGNIDVEGFAHAIQLAYLQASQGLPDKIKRQLSLL
jgi:glycerol-3-phosphate acyltransferase PlsX